MQKATSHFSQTLMKNKTILITGGSRGGMLLEMAKFYLQHEAKGVVLMSRKAETNNAAVKELKKYGPCHGELGDVSNIEDCKRVVANAISKFGSIDVLVNGAAGNFLATASKLSTNGFKKVLEIDTVGTFNMC